MLEMNDLNLALFRPTPLKNRQASFHQEVKVTNCISFSFFLSPLYSRVTKCIRRRNFAFTSVIMVLVTHTVVVLVDLSEEVPAGRRVDGMVAVTGSLVIVAVISTYVIIVSELISVVASAVGAESSVIISTDTVEEMFAGMLVSSAVSTVTGCNQELIVTEGRVPHSWSQ